MSFGGRRLFMNRKWVYLIAVAAFLLGIAAIVIPLLLRPRPAGLILDELNGAVLLEQVKPAEAKFISPPDVVSQRGENSYYATAFAAWEGSTDARKVVVNLEKQLITFINGKGGNYGAGQHHGGSTPFGEKGVSTFIREYSEFNFPEQGLSGVVYISLSCGEGQKCCVTLALYVERKKRD
jgi:hypothetical protein